MRFEPLYHGDQLSIVNPHGDVGIATLWSPRRATLRVLERLSPALLDQDTSRIAVVANLYGDGMHLMFCNLLNNPQIRHLVAVGEQRGLPTVDELEAFLRDGVVGSTMLGAEVLRIPGTGRVLPPMVGFDAERLRAQIDFGYHGPIGRLSTEFVDRLDALPRHTGTPPERVRVEIPSVDYTYRPSDVYSHEVSRRRALDAWRELVTRVLRFGLPVDLTERPRRELLNARVVITEPGEDTAEDLDRHGFVLADLLAYQDTMLDGTAPIDVAYSYGNRLRGYFPQSPDNRDALGSVIELLRSTPRTRRAYIALWDTAADLPGSSAGGGPSSTPCLVGISFRMVGERLTMTASYRSHNLLTAWLPNVYGLIAVQRFVAEAIGVPVGPLSVISHQLSADPSAPRYGIATAIESGWTRDGDTDPESGRPMLREDPQGHFAVSVDEEAGEIVAEHRVGTLTIKTYRGRFARAIAEDVAGDMAVGLVSHALWLGGELTAAEARLPPRRHDRPPGRARRE